MLPMGRAADVENVLTIYQFNDLKSFCEKVLTNEVKYYLIFLGIES